MKFYSHFLFFYLFCQIAFGQNERPVVFSQLDVDNNLSQGPVTSILKDKQGFMWFGTEDGLCKYDGYKLKVFRHNHKDTATIPNNHIKCLYEDRSGDLWIGTSGEGLAKYNKDDDSFTSYGRGVILSIYESSDSTFWISTLNGLNFFDRRKGELVAASTKNDLFSKVNGVSYYIIEDNHRNIWIGTGNGIFIYYPEIHKIQHIDFCNFAFDSDQPCLTNSVIEDHFGNYWVATDNGLHLFNYSGDTIVEKKINSKSYEKLVGRITSMCIDNHNNLWMGREDGLVKFNLFDGEVISFTANPQNEQALSHGSILSLYYDNQEILWIGTSSGEVNIYDKNQFAFSKHRIYNSENPKLNSKIVTSFEEDGKGNIWIGTDGGGLFLWQRESNRFTAFYPDSKENYFPGYSILTLKLSQNKETLWIGTYDQGLIELNIRTKNVRVFNVKNGKLKNNSVYSIIEDKNGNIWAGTNGGGVTRLNKLNGEYQTFSIEPGASIRALCEDSIGNIWIGTYYGIHIYSPVSRKLDYLTPYNSNVSEIIYSIFRDSKNRMWIGSMGGGLHLYNPKTRMFTLFSEEEGLCNNIVCSIIEDSKGAMWVGTYNGISCFNPNNRSFKNYMKKNGLQSNRFSRGAVFKTKNGTILLGSTDGFNLFYAEGIRKNSVIPPVVITDFQLYNKSVSPGMYNLSSTGEHNTVPEITLSYDQTVFSIEFAALNFTGSERNRYAYMLEGFDKGWNRIGDERKATYTNLPPGEYVFRVIASNNDGVWNKEGASMKITITPPFWKTGYAYLLYGIVFLCLLYYIYREIKLRERLRNEIIYQKLTAEKIEELNQLKLNFFTNISHELRTPLSLIIDPLRKIINEEVPITPEAKNLNQLAFKNATRLSGLVNQLLDFRKFSGAHKLEPVYVDIIESIEEVCRTFDQRAQERSIEFNLSVNTSLRKVWIDTDKLEKILINLISNAFKFTPDHGKIHLNVTSTMEEDKTTSLEIYISDNGPGISKTDKQKIFDLFFQAENIPRYDMESSGIGLALAKELVLLHGGQISEVGNEGEGAVFFVKIPLKEHSPESIKMSSEEKALKETLETNDFYDQNKKTDSDDRSIVLVVEDNPELRDYIAKNVLLDYHVEQASTGKEGFEKALALIPDLIISDIMMPDGNGLELCEKIKDNEKTSHIPVILLTAKQTDDNKIEGYRKGADAYVSKPFNSSLLTMQVENLLEARKKLRILFSRTENKCAAEPEVSNVDNEFLKKAEVLILDNLLNDGFDVESFASAFAMNRKQLSRKLKALTNQTPHEYIIMVRLNKALELLITRDLNISEVAYLVGFSEPTNFSRTFTKIYGKSPREYISELTNKSK